MNEYQEAMNNLINGNLSDYHDYIRSMGRREFGGFVHWLYFQGPTQNSRINITRAFHHSKVALERISG